MARIMRLLMLAFACGLVTASAHAQGGAAGSAHGKQQQPDKGAPQKPKIDDKAYNAALRNIPDRKYDAWQGVR